MGGSKEALAAALASGVHESYGLQDKEASFAAERHGGLFDRDIFLKSIVLRNTVAYPTDQISTK